MTSPQPPSDSSSLLVPVHVDALCVDPQSQQSFSISPPDYGALAAFKSPIPTPFASEAPHQQPALQGIHLHWALPDALTRGKQSAPGQPVEFPLVPNRWLVVRFEAGGVKWDCQKVTVIRSDYLGDAASSDPGTTPFLDPTKATTPEKIQATNLGKSYDVQSWVSRTDQDSGNLFLQAVGPGNATFAAYQPFMQDVFAYTDPASGLPASGTHHYAYLVVGWFSDPAVADPLRGVDTWMSSVWPEQSVWQQQTPKERFETLLADLQWSLLDAAPDTPPATSLYHGYVYDVDWPVPAVGAGGGGPNVPDPANVRVAVGNTSADALAALIQHDASDSAGQEARDQLAQLLQAAQYDLLDDYGQPGGSVYVEQRIRHAWFGDRPGGTTWQMAGAVPDAAGKDAQPVSLTPAQQTSLNQQLAALNANQRAYDRAARELASLQSELYRYWWKNGTASYVSGDWQHEAYDPGLLFPTGTTPQWTQTTPAGEQRLLWDYSPGSGLKDYFQATLYPDLQQEVWTQLCTARSLAAHLPGPSDPEGANRWANAHVKLPDGAGGTRTPGDLGLVLRAGTAPRFHFPKDPVVLFAGANRSQKHGEDGRYNEDGTLTCRLPGETLTGVEVGQAAVNADSLAGVDLDPLSAYTKIPAIPSLLVEAFFADFNNASVVHGATPSLSEADVTNAMKGPGGTWPNPHAIGTAPVPFALIDWEQAWAPLFLEWSVQYYPTGSVDEDTREHTFEIGDWAFDGEDYGWQGTGFHPDYTTSYSGRTFVTPHASLLFKNRIEKYLKGYPGVDSQALEKLIDTVAGWDVLAQSLSGLTDQLITLMDEETLPPPAGGGSVACPPGDTPDVGALIGDNYHSLPVLLNSTTSNNLSGTSNFYPVRGGFLVISSLKLVDTFGQILETVQSNTPNGFVPVLGQGLTPTQPPKDEHDNPLAGAIQLPPRVVQPGRLDFRFLSADGSGNDIQTADDPGAICGWLLPNHLDGSLAVYDSAGQLLGEVLPLGTGNDNWRPRPGPPGAAPPKATPAGIDNEILRDVVVSVAGQSSEVFGDFLRIVDETLWMVDPLGGRKDQMLSALIGRPLAVVQAQLKLVLEGPPVRNQLWQRMAQGTTVYPHNSDIAKPPWKPWIDIGEIEDVVFPVQLGNLQLRDDGLLGYFAGGSYTSFNTLHLPPDLSPGDPYLRQIGAGGNFINLSFQGDAQTVTLILDPRGVVHAASGILPTEAAALPPSAVEDFLRQLEITFRTGPLIADPGTLRVPQPAEDHGTWNWLQRVGTGSLDSDWEAVPIVNATGDARLPDDLLQLREGWLQPTISRGSFGVEALDPSPPLLRYVLTSAPFPLVASASSSNPDRAVLTIVVSNPTINPVPLEGIKVQIPLDLTDQPGNIGPVPPPEWKYDTSSSDPAAGAFVFEPNNPPFKVTGPLAFVFENVVISTQPGLSIITVKDSTPATVDLQATKFPNGWGEVLFWASDPNLPYPGAAELNWDGPDGAGYELDYYTPQTNVVKVPGLGHTGKYPPPPAGFSGQTGFPLQQTTIFTLNVDETISARSYHAQKQITVTVAAPAPKILSFTGQQLDPKKGLPTLRLSWSLEHADSFELDQTVGAHGQTETVPVPQGQSTFLVQPSLPTVYTLRAMSVRTAAIDSATVSVNVTPPVPIGTISAWCGVNVNAIPAGWLLCDGTPYSQATYPELETVIGSASVPNLQGYFLRGIDPSGTVDPDRNRAPGNVQADAFKTHTHTITKDLYSYGTPYKSAGPPGIPYCSDSAAGPAQTLVTDGTGDSETRPKNVAVYYLIYAGPPQS